MARRTSTPSKQKKAPAKKKATANDRPRPSLMRRLLRWAVRMFVVGVLLGIITLAIGYWYFSQGLPDFKKVTDYRPAQVSRILAADGTVLAEFYRERRTVIPRERIPEVLVQAVLAAEDAEFYEHQGLDYSGMLRALYNSVRAGQIKGSGSTITQQTVKNMLLTHERSLRRKAREIILTRRLEGRLSKDDILTIYLNTIYLGHGRFGVQEASQYYFAKDAMDLNVNEAATLAGIIQSPERLSPRKHPKEALRRRAYVLSMMAKNGFITDEVAQQVDHSPIELAEVPPERVETAMWFVNLVKRKVISKLGEDLLYEGGLRIQTTLDLRRQKVAQASLRDGLLAVDGRQGFGAPKGRISNVPKWRKKRRAALEVWRQVNPERRKNSVPLERTMVALVTEVTRQNIHIDLGFGEAEIDRDNAARFANDKGKLPFKAGDEIEISLRADGPKFPKKMKAVVSGAPQGAMVVMNPTTREVLALVGGYDFTHYPYDRATQAKRQPGSAFKPFVYGAALESKKFTPATVVLDAPETWRIGPGKWWKPKNYDGRYRGEVNLRTALAKSINTVAVKVTQEVSVKSVQRFARSAGLSSGMVDNLTLALGSSEVSVMELTNAYATIANGGTPGDAKFITEVSDARGVLDVQFQVDGEDRPESAIDSDITWLLRNMMRSVVTAGSGRRIGKLTKREVVGKTGTSNEARDTWFVGLLPDVVVTAWVGFDAPQPLGRKETGGGTVAPIVGAYLGAAEARGPGWGRPPAGIEERSIDKATGLLAGPDSKAAYTEYFLRGTAPTETAAAPDAVRAADFMMNQLNDRPEDPEDAPNIDVTPLPPIRPTTPFKPMSPAPIRRAVAAPIKPARAAPAPLKPNRRKPGEIGVPNVPIADLPSRLEPPENDDEDRPE